MSKSEFFLEKTTEDLCVPSPLQQLHSVLFEQKNIRFFVKRDDLIHPLVSGNKWRKLKYNLQQARLSGKQGLLSFGGAYSNHIYALAAAGKSFDFRTIGIIRGESSAQLNPTLQFCQRQGMELHFIDRLTYRNKHDSQFLQNLNDKFGNVFIIPEGGSNEYALPGCAEIISELQQQVAQQNVIVAAAMGSGATVAGMLSHKSCGQVLGVSVLKGGEFLRRDVARLLGREPESLDLRLDYHFGGYAKVTDSLMTFIAKFKQTCGISIEPVYTGKLFYALFDLITKDYFLPGTTIVALHTGGLQGLAGFSSNYDHIF